MPIGQIDGAEKSAPSLITAAPCALLWPAALLFHTACVDRLTPLTVRLEPPQTKVTLLKTRAFEHRRRGVTVPCPCASVHRRQTVHRRKIFDLTDAQVLVVMALK